MIDSDTPMTTVAEVTDYSTFNPLAFDLMKAVTQLSTLVEGSTFAGVDLQLLSAPTLATSRSQLLDIISKAMLRPEWTTSIVRLFRPIVIDLVARWTLPGFTTFLDSASVSPNASRTVYKIELVAKAFSTVLPIVPQVKR
jgi:midasin